MTAEQATLRDAFLDERRDADDEALSALAQSQIGGEGDRGVSTMTPAASIVRSSDALVDVRAHACQSSAAQLGKVTEVGRAVYDLRVGDWVYVVPGSSREAVGSHLCVPQADFNCLRLPWSSPEGLV